MPDPELSPARRSSAGLRQQQPALLLGLWRSGYDTLAPLALRVRAAVGDRDVPGVRPAPVLTARAGGCEWSGSTSGRESGTATPARSAPPRAHPRSRRIRKRSSDGKYWCSAPLRSPVTLDQLTGPAAASRPSPTPGANPSRRERPG